MRGRHIYMASSVKKYLVIGSAIIVLSLLLYAYNYYRVDLDMERLPNIRLHADAINLHNIENSILEQKVHHKSNGDSFTKSLHIEGSSTPLNRMKQHILSVSKVKTTELPDEKYFQVDRQVKDVNCKALVQSDESEIKRAVELTANTTKKEISPKEYIQMASNCSHFIERRGYIMSSLTKEEEEFPLAFSVLMYKAVEQSERLLRAIYRPQNIYCIHVDANSKSDIFESMSAVANCFNNVFIAPNRFKVEWGEMSVLEPELLCMEELWKRSNTWKYFINLTGQEFPLRTNYELARIFTEYNGANDVEGLIKRAHKDRWENAGTPPHGIVPVKGAIHIIVNRGFVDYVLHDKRARDLLNWTKNVYIPDEAFFSTLNHNPHLGVPGSYKGLPETDDVVKPFLARFKNWGDWSCHGQWVRGICIYGVGDLSLLDSRKEMFANKFYLDYQHFALDCMEEIHFNNTRDEYMGKLVFDSSRYSKLGFVLNKV